MVAAPHPLTPGLHVQPCLPLPRKPEPHGTAHEQGPAPADSYPARFKCRRGQICHGGWHPLLSPPPPPPPPPPSPSLAQHTYIAQSERSQSASQPYQSSTCNTHPNQRRRHGHRTATTTLATNSVLAICSWCNHRSPLPESVCPVGLYMQACIYAWTAARLPDRTSEACRSRERCVCHWEVPISLYLPPSLPSSRPPAGMRHGCRRAAVLTQVHTCTQ
ncbi:hypothetical protein K431DRAFT_57796 [Polychaeton citri CBS 116435]|uniref:Uncharacterized protein n=1 Tax=Polychaeton citri CBS 116435 TaxID=1314669 RepID=A0A9P4QCL8_9PEZI|nr:hypothetical protein K431DRAFT_57796 [Polychaeton citri CBS 116435]